MGNISVLFVDARFVHQSLRRIIVSRNLPVDLFVASMVAQASQVLSEGPCDAIVTDASLSDMESLDLLAMFEHHGHHGHIPGPPFTPLPAVLHGEDVLLH